MLVEALCALENAGLVCRLEVGRAGRAWALDPARFYATARSAVMRCAGSNRTLVVPEQEADLWLGVPCLDLGVQAVYERHAVEPPTWFGRLYHETLIRRLVAAEHTALLTRDERDRLQQRFSSPNPRPWEPNLLSATPTLELGIDVGDLSTVVLCSVPPAQANYLQRVGRAGRRDFRVCRRCGTVQTSGDDGAQHASTCGARNDAQAPIADCLYLYREFRSEAVQMLLPVLDTPGSERRVSSFVAALELGLRRHFSGRIDHLRATTRRSPRQGRSTGGPEPAGEPEDGGGAAHQYLLLYDTVPSGTGYLKELMAEPGKLLSVFEEAREALKSCACNQEPEKDGCYRCVFAYRRSREMAETSRDTAVEMLDRILAHKDELEEVPSLGGLTINATFDSELEARFVEALRRVEVNGARAVQVRADLVQGKPGYVLKVGDHTYLRGNAGGPR